MPKILLIEDDQEIIKLYKMTFSLEDLDLVVAGDGEEGLAKVLSEQPSLILLDIMIPLLDGFQVLLRLKSNQETKNIPVVVLTNLSGVKDAQSCIYIGAERYLIKSDNEPKKVVSVVKEILSGIQVAN